MAGITHEMCNPPIEKLDRRMRTGTNGIIDNREISVVVIGISKTRNPDLTETAGTTDRLPGLAGAGQSGQKHCNQQGNNADHDQQFDECERPIQRVIKAVFCLHPISLYVMRYV